MPNTLYLRAKKKHFHSLVMVNPNFSVTLRIVFVCLFVLNSTDQKLSLSMALTIFWHSAAGHVPQLPWQRPCPSGEFFSKTSKFFTVYAPHPHTNCILGDPKHIILKVVCRVKMSSSNFHVDSKNGSFKNIEVFSCFHSENFTPFNP